MRINFVVQILGTPYTKMILTIVREVDSFDSACSLCINVTRRG